MMVGSLTFAPLIPMAFLLSLAVVVVLMTLLAVARGLSGWALRGIAGLFLLAALAEPVLRDEDRVSRDNVVFVVTDRSASNRIADRATQTEQARDALLARLGALAGLDIRQVDLAGSDETGTALTGALSEQIGNVAPDRIAGAIILSDGQIHDPQALSDFPAPVHLLRTGRGTDWDRQLQIETAPTFGVVGESVSISLNVRDDGAAPREVASVPLIISLDGDDPMTFSVPLGETVSLPVTLGRGGVNVLHISTPEGDGELTARNNEALVSINGVRDRLRVLLVSGEPYPGERTWRNLLKSDAAVELVHFTILRPPEKQDFVPVQELSLIAFPTQELFLEKVDEFDLIIFDRYKRRGILPPLYFANIARYVREGGAILFSVGEDFAGAESLYHTPLRDILPITPTARVFEELFLPRVTMVGARHPVTDGLEALAPGPRAADGPGWGRWGRQVEFDVERGDVVMEGAEGRPLLVLDRADAGRVAVLASDQVWLWSRGFEGGGPQQELLRRLAHWLMKEPELEEEKLLGAGEDDAVIVRRRTLAETAPPVTAISPEGAEVSVELDEVAPGQWEGRLPVDQNGPWRLREGNMSAVAIVGPSNSREFADVIATDKPLEPLIRATRGGVFPLSRGMPDFRMVREDRVAAGTNWAGLADRDAYVVRDIRERPLLPGWAYLVLASGLMVAAWRIEGR